LSEAVVKAKQTTMATLSNDNLSIDAKFNDLLKVVFVI